MMLIVFEGLDGVGKSTIVEGVVESFQHTKCERHLLS